MTGHRFRWICVGVAAVALSLAGVWLVWAVNEARTAARRSADL